MQRTAWARTRGSGRVSGPAVPISLGANCSCESFAKMCSPAPCGGRRVVTAFITEKKVIEQILGHLGIPRDRAARRAREGFGAAGLRWLAGQRPRVAASAALMTDGRAFCLEFSERGLWHATNSATFARPGRAETREPSGRKTSYRARNAACSSYRPRLALRAKAAVGALAAALVSLLPRATCLALLVSYVSPGSATHHTWETPIGGVVANAGAKAASAHGSAGARNYFLTACSERPIYRC